MQIHCQDVDIIAMYDETYILALSSSERNSSYLFLMQMMFLLLARKSH